MALGNLVPQLYEYFRVKDGAEYFDVCQITLRNWEAARKIWVLRHGPQEHRKVTRSLARYSPPAQPRYVQREESMTEVMDLLDLSDEECFLCEPEPWRTVYLGRDFRVVAGVGPLCPGYVLLSPRKHIHTAADLSGESLFEFLATADILTSILEHHYGPGYTAYEHGQLGACRPREFQEDFRTYCHHCHRVFIPHVTGCENEIHRWFDRCTKLASPADICRLQGQAYVFYETGSLGDVRVRCIFTEERGVSSQFMRRILAPHLSGSRYWSWAHDLGLPEMIETVSQLRGDFLGLNHAPRHRGGPAGCKFHGHVSIDGYSCAGKTALAHLLANELGFTMLDTGLVFRALAHAEHTHTPRPSIDEIAILVANPKSCTHLRSPEIHRMARDLAHEESTRDLFSSIVRKLLGQTDHCVLVGRDMWRFVGTDALRIRVEASLRTRVHRHVLSMARGQQELLPIQDAVRDMRVSDKHESERLPPLDLPGLLVVDNDRRPLRQSFLEILRRIGAQS